MPTGPKLTLPPEVATVVSSANALFEESGVKAYASGGFVRDILLGRRIADIDISVDANPLEIGPRVAEALGGSSFPLDTERRHLRVIPPDAPFHIDLLPLRGSIELDLHLRDYTIGALAASLPALISGSAAVIDQLGSLADLRSGIVRLVSEQALIDDPLRLLRGVRLAVQLNFEMTDETRGLIAKNAALIAQTAPDRRRDELLLIMATERAGEGVRMLEDLGLLTLVLPELDATRGVEQPKEHTWDVFNHAVQAVAAMDWLLLERPPSVEPGRTLWTELWQHLAWWPPARIRLGDELSQGISRMAVLKLAALLHDIGKPETKSTEADGRIRFFGHSEAGARIAGRLLRRLRFPTAIVKHVTAMVDAHLRPLLIAREGAPSTRAVHRFFRDTGDAAVDTLFLSLADHLATTGPRVTVEGWRRHLAVVAYIIATELERDEKAPNVKLIAGEDLMAKFDLDAGPLIGELLAAIREAQELGDVSTKEQALELAGQHLARKKGNR